ncbi:MAG TPA: hypothetical protein VMM58_07575 [Bacteroidota bacterium]|nr:hypothetical protein [Bacteroidota bacterium]
MKATFPASILFLITMILIPLSPLWGQQKTVMPQSQKSSAPTVSFFVEGNYFGPKFAEVNAVYSTIENNLSLPAGTDFKNYYFVLAGVRFSPSNTQAIQGEFGGSVLKTVKDNSTNFLQEYYGGGSYILSFPLPMISVYAGGGLGCVWLNTQRTYSTRLGVAEVNAQLAQMHGIVGLEFFNPSGVSFALEGRYNYATTISPRRADLDFTLKGIAGGIRIGVPIIL